LKKQFQLQSRRAWFLDETGVKLSLAREYARAAKGQRALGTVPKNYGEGVTLLGVLNSAGQAAALEVRGATGETVMIVFIRHVLAEVVSAGDVIVMDNLTAHKTFKVQAEFAALGVEVVYLPPYSPDLNPIEKCWSKLKTYLKKSAARNYTSLSKAISLGLKTITATDAANWVKHCGYV
jgi:transposase